MSVSGLLLLLLFELQSEDYYYYVDLTLAARNDEKNVYNVKNIQTRTDIHTEFIFLLSKMKPLHFSPHHKLSTVSCTRHPLSPIFSST